MTKELEQGQQMAEPNIPTDAPELMALREPIKSFSLPVQKELSGLSTQMGASVPGVSVPTNYEEAARKLKTPMDVSRAEAGLLQRQSQLEKDVEIARQAKEQYQAEAEASIATQRREAQEKIQQNLEAVRAAFPRPQMHPTKDNIQSLSTLFGLIGVIGMAIGGSGKQSATGALNAMAGMMKGWQQGRADLWKREMQEFDKEMARIKAILEDAYRDAEKAEKALVTNTEEARALAQVAQAKLGGQVSKQILEIKGIIPWAEYLRNVLKKDFVKAEEMSFQREKFGAEQADRKARLEIEKARLDIEREKLTGKQLKEKEASSLEGLDSLSLGLEKLKKDFKPEYAGLGVLGFGADAELEYKRRLGDKKGQEAVSWWSRYQQLQAPNRHALFGGTLTGNELKNYQSFTAKPSDSAKVVENFLQDQIDFSSGTASNRRRSLESSGYKVPEKKPRDFESTYSGTQTTSQEQIARPKTDEEFNALPEGTIYIDPEDGKQYRK